ncbi:MAG TPA: class I SAM-dependent methyltransferase [archaeon]|nr:class I SAM-dependent methyltransferase [archaeon]
MPGPHEHVRIVSDLVRLFRPCTYVELGVQNCHTFNFVTGMGVIERAAAVDIRLNGVKKRKGVECYQMTTDEFVRVWKGRIDLLFIDADHSYYQVKKDFFGLIRWVPYFRGIILLHDTYPLKELAIPSRAGDAWKFAKEIHRHYPNLEIVTLPGPTCGLSIVRKVLSKYHMEWENEN